MSVTDGSARICTNDSGRAHVAADFDRDDAAMTDDKDPFSTLGAASPQPYCDGLSDRTANQKDGSDQSACPRSTKKPYGKPTYRFERVFETMALSCGKVGPVEFQCRFNRKNS